MDSFQPVQVNRNTSTKRKSLLGRLAGTGWFSRRAEVTATMSMTLLLEEELFKRSFLRALTKETGVDLHSVSSFHAESVLADGNRVDVEGVDANGRPLVMVEAKFGALLTGGQIGGYFEDQSQRLGAGSAGVLVVLVPDYRVHEARLLIESLSAVGSTGVGRGTVSVVTMTWRGIVQLWERELEESKVERLLESPHADLAQFEELCLAFGGMKSEGQVPSEWERLGERFLPVIDAVTSRLSEGKRLPLVTTSAFAPSRYVESNLPGLFGALGIHQVLSDDERFPLWLRFHRDTGKEDGGIATIRARFTNSKYANRMRTDDGHVWIPMDVDEQLDDLGLVSSLIDECRELLKIAAGEAI